MSELIELAERCEKAVGPDRYLDIEIAVAIDWRWEDWEEGDATPRGQAQKHGLAWLQGRATGGFNSVWRNMPRYTASIDAAKTLYVRVPERIPSNPRLAVAEALRQRALAQKEQGDV